MQSTGGATSVNAGTWLQPQEIHGERMIKMLKINDILSCSWGSEQTNVDFYQVVKATEKTVTIREIESGNHAAWTGEATPMLNKFIGEPMKRKVISIPEYHDEFVKIESYSRARKWDGKPVKYSTYA